MTPLNPAISSVALDAQGRIAQDIACIKCSYNLRTLSADGVCPECATPTGRSIHGDFLRFASPEWVEKLASGMNWIVGSIIISILFGCISGGVGAASRGQIPVGLVGIAGLALGIVRVIGYWLVTTPDPAQEQQESPSSARRVARFTVVLNYLLSWLAVGAAVIPSWIVMVFMVVGYVTGMVELICILIYARQLALRIPDLKMARECRQLMWGWAIVSAMPILLLIVMPLVAGSRGMGGASMGILGLGIFVVVATLIVSVFTLLLILRFRRLLSMAAMNARTTWAVSQPAFKAS